ncbi:MAG: hypothetical protein ACXADW_13535 [Candidatus Hodarchaeales archaeon]|jgi:hypothetical protein
MVQHIDEIRERKMREDTDKLVMAEQICNYLYADLTVEQERQLLNKEAKEELTDFEFSWYYRSPRLPHKKHFYQALPTLKQSQYFKLRKAVKRMSGATESCLIGLSSLYNDEYKGYSGYTLITANSTKWLVEIAENLLGFEVVCFIIPYVHVPIWPNARKLVYYKLKILFIRG